MKKRDLILKEVPQRTFSVAETFNLLKAKPIWLMSWGARNFTSFESKALFFNVSGNHFRGIVLITLDFSDTYTITLLSTQWNVKKTIQFVYCDELSDTLDTVIERIPDYAI
jgi:mRNA-degrading endonuclease HigB of HigAB toxin-antitoxin module